MKVFYEKKYKSAQFDADLQRRNRLQFCFPTIMKGKRVVSVGSGAGVDIEFLVAENEVHAVDVMDEALEIAESKGMLPHALDLNTGEELPFEDGSVDVVVATDILEHLFEPLRTLTEIRRILTEEGFAILSVPNHFFWRMRLRILLGGDLILPFHENIEQWEYFHIRFFTSKGFEKFLKMGGFRITARHYGRFNNVPRGLPQVIDRKLAKWFPDLFSIHFVVKAIAE